MCAFGFLCFMQIVAHVALATVFLLIGSRSRFSDLRLGNCLATRLLYLMFDTTIMLSSSMIFLNRLYVVCSIDSPEPRKSTNCLGSDCRLTGHSLAPMPPASIIQKLFLFIQCFSFLSMFAVFHFYANVGKKNDIR